jgi:ribonuclease HI
MESNRHPMHLFTDGASRGNPGPAGGGVVINNADGSPLLRKAFFFGESTNNAAEYNALIHGLEEALKLSPQSLVVFLDSELVVRQVNGQYRVRHKDLLPLYQRAMSLLKKIPKVRVAHIPREQNKEADQLANEGIDQILL